MLDEVTMLSHTFLGLIRITLIQLAWIYVALTRAAVALGDCVASLPGLDKKWLEILGLI